MRSNLEKTILLKNMVCGEEMEGNLTKGPILKTLTKLAIPIMASSFLGTLYNLTDMAWIGLLCMPSLGMMTINALVSSDSVLIPVQAAYLPVKG